MPVLQRRVRTRTLNAASNLLKSADGGLERLAVSGGALLYDPRRVSHPGLQVFDPDYWRSQGTVSELAGGRGSIVFITAGERRWALRRYLRGGLPAKLSREHYLYLGEERTRSFAELRLLAALQARGLPVPAPVAAGYQRRGLAYVAWLLTERLPSIGTLTELLLQGAMSDAQWSAIGRCLRRFHDAGVQHADLNANNILLGAAGEVWVLDFDRGRQREAGPWSAQVLRRLARSLAKVSRGRDTAWQQGFATLQAAHDAKS